MFVKLSEGQGLGSECQYIVFKYLKAKLKSTRQINKLILYSKNIILDESFVECMLTSDLLNYIKLRSQRTNNDVPARSVT